MDNFVVQAVESCLDSRVNGLISGRVALGRLVRLIELSGDVAD
jgi:hypothetical protein